MPIPAAKIPPRNDPITMPFAFLPITSINREYLSFSNVGRVSAVGDAPNTPKHYNMKQHLLVNGVVGVLLERPPEPPPVIRTHYYNKHTGQWVERKAVNS